jgi:ABC-2 type transport system permease protein
MKKVLLVLKHEFITVVRRPSFILTLILVPVGALVFTFIISAISSGANGTNNNDIVSSLIMPQQQPLPEGYVDQAGLIKLTLPDTASHLQSFSTEVDAQQALASGKISAYYVLPADYIQSGTLSYVRPDFNPLGSTDRSSAFDNLLSYNLTSGNKDLNNRVANPLNVQSEYLSPQPQRNPDEALTFFLPYAVTMLFYIVILTSSSLMLSSVNTEKQNRVLEILATSITPTQMLTGKIIALGLAGLVQTLVWSGIGFLALRLGGQTSSVSVAFQLPISILVWGVVFFLLGYAVYASLMAGIGALVTNLREASQVTTIVIIPLVLPLLLLQIMVTDPNGTTSLILSLFPLTAPVAMMSRMAATQVPIWQILLAVVLLLGFAYLIIRSVAGLFRAQTLLSGQSFNVKTYLMALMGKTAQ